MEGETIKCVQGKKMEEALKAVGKQADGRKDLIRTFTPSVNEKTYFEDYDVRRAKGMGIKK